MNRPLSFSSSTLMAPPVPRREVRPQNSLSELNNKRKSFSGPVGPKGIIRAAQDKGMLHFQKRGTESVSRGQG